MSAGPQHSQSTTPLWRPCHLPKPHTAPFLRGGGGNPRTVLLSLTHAIAHQVEILLLLAARPAPPASQCGVGVAGVALHIRRATARLAGGMTGWVRKPTLVRLLGQSTLTLSPPRKASPYQHQHLRLQKRDTEAWHSIGDGRVVVWKALTSPFGINKGRQELAVLKRDLSLALTMV